jgi:hypothetical protein
MPINKNHEFEDLDGVKCSIVEKNALAPRVEFLRNLLALNGYQVVVVPSPPAKVAPALKPVAAVVGAVIAAVETVLPSTQPETLPLPETFTVGVTDVMFNPTNAVFGRLLRTADGKVVTLAYWEQKETIAKDDVPYFENIK